MQGTREQIIGKGKRAHRDEVKVADKVFVVMGKLIKIVKIKEELYEDVEDPAFLIEEMKKNGIKADIFTFWQRIPETEPKFDYYMEADNYAAVPVTSYEIWLTKQIDRNAKRAVNKSKANGVITRTVIPNEEFIKGIVDIFNETPVRQGRKFWHYGKGFEDVKKEIIERDLDISEFVGAYYEEKLIGFIKLIYTKGYANFAQILSKLKDREKYPTNALIAKAVAICAEKKIPYLVYERFAYGRKGSDSLSDFKRRNGFERIEVPRYYVPLSLKGRIILRLNLQHGLFGVIPKKILNMALGLRKRFYERKYAGG